MRLFFLSLITFLLQACSTSNETHIQQTELLTLIQTAGVNPLIVDVRSTSEYQAGHIPSAVHIPFWQSFSSDALANNKKQQDVYLYCEHGPRAGIAKFAYFIAGFKKIRYIEGHMTAWRKAGLPLETR